MRKLIVSTFASLDGVMQAPGAPQEDPMGGFALGGWSFGYWDEVMQGSMSGFDGSGRSLLLGRRTYEIFEAFWPYQAKDHPVAMKLNSARKYVASRTLASVPWENSELLKGEVAAAVAKLKSEAGLDLQVIGSANLVQTLQANRLVDEFNIWTFPVVLGKGKRLFESTAVSSALKLVQTKHSTTGVIMSTYVPAGEIRPGTFATEEPSAKEMERRAKLARESR